MSKKIKSDVIKFKRGSIWFIDAPPIKKGERRYPGMQIGSRPIVIISNDEYNRISSTVNYLTITSNINNAPDENTRVKIIINDDYPISDIQCEQIFTVSKEYIKNFKGFLSDEKMKEVDITLSKHLNLIINKDDNIDNKKLINIKDKEVKTNNQKDNSNKDLEPENNKRKDKEVKINNQKDNSNNDLEPENNKRKYIRRSEEEIRNICNLYYKYLKFPNNQNSLEKLASSHRYSNIISLRKYVYRHKKNNKK